jgi:hypothetical protein
MEHIQKGANVKNGVERVIHSTKCGLSMYSNYHILATDFRNAFNSLDRALLLERVETDSPTMYPLVHALYSAPADLWVSGTSTEGVQSRRIQSSTGSQQGCVHGAHAFNEGSHPTLLHIKSILADDPNSNINAYVDDHTSRLTTAQLFAVLAYLLESGPRIGLHLAPSKCHVLLGHMADPAEALDIQRRLTDPYGVYKLQPENAMLSPSTGGIESKYCINVLGSPVGSDRSITLNLRHRIEELRIEAAHLQTFPDPQVAFLLLKNCFSLKVQFLLRTIPPRLTIPELIEPFNLILRDVLCSILSIPQMTDSQFEQCCLDLDSGGLGLGITPMTAHAAFAASFLASLTSIEKDIPDIRSALRNNNDSPHLEDFKSSVIQIGFENHDPESILSLASEGKADKLQSTFLAQYKAAAAASYLASQQGNHKSIARYLSTATKESGAALLAIPKTPKLQFSPQEFIIFLLRRLGIRIPQINQSICTCFLRTRIDGYGTHLIACKLGKERFINHNTMVIAIRDCAKSCGLSVTVEPRNAFKNFNPDNNKRPDVILRGLDRDQHGDIMITDAIQSRTNSNNAGIPGYAAAAGEALKKIKYDEDSREAGMLFLPVIFETFGRWGSSFEAYFKRLMNYGAQFRKLDLGILTSYWRKRLSVTLHRTIAASILSKIGKYNSAPHEDESNWNGAIVEQSYVRF